MQVPCVAECAWNGGYICNWQEGWGGGGGGYPFLRKYFWWSLCNLHLPACHVSHVGHVGDSCLCCCCLCGWYLLSASWLPSVLILQLNTVNFVCHFFPHLPQQGVLTGQKSREWKKKLCFTALVAQSIKAKYCSTGSVNLNNKNFNPNILQIMSCCHNRSNAAPSVSQPI